MNPSWKLKRKYSYFQHPVHQIINDYSSQELRPSFLSPYGLHEEAEKVEAKVYRTKKYQYKLELFAKQLKKEYRENKASPEDHPMYGEEWKKFWHRRHDELKKEGKIDPNDFDYVPEWTIFWMKRMQEIYEESIDKEKAKLRIQFDLSDDIEDNDKKKQLKRSLSPISISSLEDIISEDDDSYSSVDSYRAKRKRSDRRSRERSFESMAYSRKSSSSKFSPSESTTENVLSIDYDGPVTLISVCRLLSALETELGSLSSNVLDLLSKALALEKLKANSCDEILMTSENTVFLETVKEKMKGLLMINVLPTHKLAAVKKCIQNIAKLIHQNPVKEEPIKNDEKNEIAMKIAEALQAVGKDDCTPDELEVLVEMYLEDDIKQPEPAVQSELESITDDDIKILLGSFSDLHEDEQNNVINYMLHLEKTDPQRVNALRKFIKVDEEVFNKEADKTALNELDDDSDDYDIEVINNVLWRNQQMPVPAKSQQNVVNYSEESSLTDNLLEINRSWQLE